MTSSNRSSSAGLGITRSSGVTDSGNYWILILRLQTDRYGKGKFHPRSESTAFNAVFNSFDKLLIRRASSRIDNVENIKSTEPKYIRLLCGCVAELRRLEHLFLNCPLMSEGRPGFFGFLACRFPGLPPDQFDYRELVFDPDPCVVSELGRFFKHGNLIWVLGTLAGEGCPECLAFHSPLLLCGEFGLDGSFGTPLVLLGLTLDSCYLLPT